MSRPAYIKQPGPVAAERVVTVATRGQALTLALAAGQRLVDAVDEAFASHGLAGGTVDISGLALGPLAYVMPALSKTGENAAFYSDVFRPAGVTRIKHGAMTFGRREGAAFYHAHALWAEADGTFTGGHILPGETVVAERGTVSAFGLADAAFDASIDPETNFTLFAPVATRQPVVGADAARSYAIRLRPNQDVATTLAAFCVVHKISHARIHGGVGSTIGAAFNDGREIENFATEVYIRAGSIAPGSSGQPVAQIDVGLVDYTGATAEGRLARGKNPVLMTFELVIEVVA